MAIEKSTDTKVLGINIDPPNPVSRPAITKPVLVKIILEENDDMPPTGLPVGLNGKLFIIQPGVEVSVPPGVVEILEHAITSVPVTSPHTRKIVGYRQRMRFPFRLVA